MTGRRRSNRSAVLRSLVTIALATLLLASGAPAQTVPAGGESAFAFATVACRTAFVAQLAAWQSTGEMFPDVADPLGGRSWRLPTRQLGAWIVVTIDPDLRPTLTRIDAREARRITFDDACSVEQRVQPMQAGASGAGAFDDDSLRALVGSHRVGVIYVWSPHMPLSVDGYRSVARVARDLGIAMTAVLDPNANARYAQAVASSARLPADALTPFRSVEMVFRNATTHAPSVLIYRNRRVIGLAVPGYRDEAGYKALIDSYLEER